MITESESFERKRDDAVAALEVDLCVNARTAVAD
jgi:hypothetical protein